MTEVNTSCKFDLARVAPTLDRVQQLKRLSPSSMPEGFGHIVVDSRKVQAGDCFIALNGTHSDGHQFIPSAISKHAALLIVEDETFLPAACTTPYLVVKSGRAAWAYLSAEVFDQPQNSLKILAVTGTNGKTSTAWIVGEILRSSGHKCLTLGTLGADFGEGPIPTNHTTPDPDILFRFLREAVDRKIEFVAMEASSHAVVQEKLLPLRFSGAAFTSFSRDHLDFHRSLDEYFAAKKQIFTEFCKPDARQIICAGLDQAQSFRGAAKDLWFYGSEADKLGEHYLVIDDIKHDYSVTTVKYRQDSQASSFQIPYFGRHAVENFCAAYLLATSQVSVSNQDFRNLRQVPGRLQLVSQSSTQPMVIVDYAHTPDALEKTLKILRQFCRDKLIVVFGCGGDRDRGKRPLMGHAAEQLADRVYVTSDNPRSEDPSFIISEILSGIRNTDRVTAVIDREDAIFSAIQEANPSDTVLIAGKGHENYQLIGTLRLPFDDREVASKALKSRDNL